MKPTMKLTVEQLEDRVLTAPCDGGWIVEQEEFPLPIRQFIAGRYGDVQFNTYTDPPALDSEGLPLLTCITPSNTRIDFGDGTDPFRFGDYNRSETTTIGHKYAFPGYYMITIHIGDFEYTRPVVVHFLNGDAPIIGDVNADRVFNSSDLVDIFLDAKYETGEKAAYHQGDFNLDQLFTSSDFVHALQNSVYEGE